MGIIQLLQKSLSELDFGNELDFPKNIQHRDVADIPNYHFKDDGLLLWDAIKSFVENITNIFYEHDNDIVEDYELQEWSSELRRY